MSGSTPGRAVPASFTFTVEQIELIRRLRNSGLSRDQVGQAFDAFDRVDVELGNLYTVPVNLGVNKSFTVTGTLARPVTTRHQQLHHQPPQTTTIPHHTTPTTTTNGQSNHHHQQQPNNVRPVVAIQPSPLVTSAPAPATPAHRRLQGVKRSHKGNEGGGPGGRVEIIRLDMQDVVREAKAVHLCSSGAEVTEVEDFSRKGPEELLVEVQYFLMNRPEVMQDDKIANAAGVSVVHVSRFLLGDFRGIPASALRKLSQWLGAWRSIKSPGAPPAPQQQCNSQTSKLLSDVIQERLSSASTGGSLQERLDSGCAGNESNALEALCNHDCESDLKPTDVKPFDVKPVFDSPALGGGGGMAAYSTEADSGGGALNFTPRRERFTFRKKHLEILETYFKVNQYPTYDERCDTALRCNDLMEQTSGRGLGEKEKMTHQNVAYWFSNRRKDIKRMAREGGLDTAEVKFPSKVKQEPSPSPPLSLLDQDSARAYWDVQASPPTPYTPLDIPSVGPVAFPGMRRSGLDGPTGAASSDGGPVFPQRSSGEGNGGVDRSSVSSDDQANEMVIKMEVQEAESAVSSKRPGSALERIAAEISSQLMSKKGGLSKTITGAATTSPGAESPEPVAAGVEAPPAKVKTEPESH